MLSLHASGNKKCITHWKKPLNREEKKRDSSLPIRKNDKTGDRHRACDKLSDCTAIDDASGMTLRSSPSPIKNIEPDQEEGFTDCLGLSYIS